MLEWQKILYYLIVGGLLVLQCNMLLFQNELDDDEIGYVGSNQY